MGSAAGRQPLPSDKGGVALLRKVVVTLLPFASNFSVLDSACLFESPGGWVMSTHKKSLYFGWVP